MVHQLHRRQGPDALLRRHFPGGRRRSGGRCRRAAGGAAGHLAVGGGTFRVTGKIGDMNVDMIVQLRGRNGRGCAGRSAAGRGGSGQGEAQAVGPGAAPARTSCPTTPAATRPRSRSTTARTGRQVPEGGLCRRRQLRPDPRELKDWKPFLTMQFDMLNPGKSELRIALNVKHKRSTDIPTRIEVPFVAKPGKNPSSSAWTRWPTSTVRRPTCRWSRTGTSSPRTRRPRRFISATSGWCRRAEAVPPPGVAESGRRGASPWRRTRPGWPHPRRQDAADHQAGDVRHAGSRRDPARPWKSFRPTTPGTRWSRTGRCTPTRRTSSPRSARTSRSVTIPTWASSSCRPTRSGST